MANCPSVKVCGHHRQLALRIRLPSFEPRTVSALDISSPPNALTFDLEHWHSATLLQSDLDDPTDHLEESVEIVLDLLDKHDVKATFFVVGEIAEEYPELVRAVRDGGHEIGSHGHTHTPLFNLTREEFETELERSTEAIEDACGVEPVGFRAPNFSVTHRTEWAFDVLESQGYQFDSSVFPVGTPMYGVSGGPRRPYRVPSAEPLDPMADGESPASLVEFPLSVLGNSVRLPVAGGFYARILPERVLKWGVHRVNKRGLPANLYFHPWEFNPAVQISSQSFYKRFISFHGIEKTREKLDSLLLAFNFKTMGSVLEEEGLSDEYPSRDVERPAEPKESRVDS